MPDSQTPPSSAQVLPFHQGEQALQERLGVREAIAQLGDRLIRSFMPDQHRELFVKLPMILLGSVDAAGQPWASVLTGGKGFVTSSDPQHLEIHTLPQTHDPLHATLALGAPIGMLGIEPHTRRRNRMNGAVEALDANGFTLRVEQSFGNCPKYIQARRAEPVLRSAPLVAAQVHRTGQLDDAMARMVTAADTYFIASAYLGAAGEAGRPYGVDISHRGGKPGFIRIDDANTLTAPDFAGNFFFNTLGNITLHPPAGLLIIDFSNGDLLHLAVDASIIWDPEQIKLFAGAQRLVRYRIKQALRIEGAFPLRWSAPQLSPVLAATGAWDAPPGTGKV
jgi:predicted pyridoxine 5'-phosphate oxidase superfamily flavin-nucleotide-binding protein